MGLALLVPVIGHAATTIIPPDGGVAEARESETTRAAIAGDYLYRLRGAFQAAEAFLRGSGFPVGPLNAQLTDWAPYGIRGHYCGNALIVWLADAAPRGLGDGAAVRISALGAHRTETGGTVSLRGQSEALPACLTAVVPADRAAVFAQIRPAPPLPGEIRELTQTLACPSGQIGTGIRQIRYARFDRDTGVEIAQLLGWRTVANDCQPQWNLRVENVALADTRYLPCQPGETGIIRQERSGNDRRVLDGNDHLLRSIVTWGTWQTVSDTCRIGGTLDQNGNDPDPEEVVTVWYDEDGNVTGDPDEAAYALEVDEDSEDAREFEEARHEYHASRQNLGNSDDDDDDDGPWVPPPGSGGSQDPCAGGCPPPGDTSAEERPGVCFGAGTLVLMGDGSSRPIEHIRLGDVVMAFEGLGPLEPRAVIGRREQIREVVSVGGTLATADHPFLRPDGSFTPIGEIGAEGRLIVSDGTDRPAPVIVPVGVMPVYDITVEGLGTYVADGWRVHNW